MNVSGDVDEMTYNYTAASLGLALAELAVDGTTVDLGSMNLAMNNVTGTTVMRTGDVRQSSQTFNSGAVTYDIDVADPEDGGRMKMNGQLDSMSFAGDGSFPP